MHNSKFNLLLFTALLICVHGCSSGGGNDDTSESFDATHVGSVSVPGLESSWVTVNENKDMGRSSALTLGGSDVVQIIFDATENITVHGVANETTTFYDYDSEKGTYTFTDGLPISFPNYYIGVIAVPGYTQAVVLPVIHPVASHYLSGAYRFKIQNTTLDTANVEIYATGKTDDDFSSGDLDINLIVYTAGEPNGVLKNMDDVASLEEILNQMLGQVGISIGKLNYETREDPDAIMEALDAGRSGIKEFLVGLSKGTESRRDKGINCFLFPRLGGGVIGLDGSIPGPAKHGTSASGVLIQAAGYGYTAKGLTEHETDLRFLAKIMAHEIGHYLGLTHTTEKNGRLSDPFSDTPECGLDNDANGDGKVAGSECRGKGAEYLMFWGIDGELIKSGDFQGTISPEEGEMANTHPSVR